MPELTLRDVMTREFVGVSESDTVAGAVRLMREEGVQSGVVLRGKETVGTISASQVFDLIADGEDVETTNVDAVVQTETPTLDPDATLGDVASAMLAADSDLILVEGNDDLLGIITARDLGRYTWGRSDLAEPREALEPETTTRTEAANEGYSTQSICEACGTLSRDLVNVNGQLLCPDCREV
ncbi:MAG: CBS domain-containing protein [archaeon]